jgi:glycine/D-amino acid oxidase-like deaminating enzyme
MGEAESEEFLPATSDFLVVGGGAAGLSIAYHLARRQAGSVVLLDRRAFGTGATNKSGGGFRRIFSERVGAQTTLRSFELLKTLESDTGHGPILNEVGYLYLLHNAEHEVEAERALGFVDELAPGTARLLPAHEAASEFPWLDTTGLASVIWSPQDGYVQPLELTGAMVTGALSHGAHLMTGVRVDSLEVSAERIAEVRTSAGTIRAGTVILASGAGAIELARTAGVELPLTTRTSQRFLVDTVPQAAHPYPFTFDLGGRFAFRGDGEGVIVGFSEVGQVFAEAQAGVHWDNARENWHRVVERVPSFAGHKITGGVWGILDRTPDAYPLIGFHEDVANLFCACGFWGSGVMQSLGAGASAADLLLDGGSEAVDVGLLDPNRFRHDRALPTHDIL